MLDLPEHHQLIGFFESEPHLLDPEMAVWEYNELTFNTSRGDDQVQVRGNRVEPLEVLRYE